ncbi:MAG: DUF4157 domain-containing protein [Bacteroidota bacterium]
MARTASALPKGTNNHQSAESQSWPVQAKLKVGSPNDHFEKEADAVADRVMQRSEKEDEVMMKGQSESSGILHMKCKDCEEEKVRMSPSGSTPSMGIQAPASVENGLSGRSGQPLPQQVNESMSEQIGADFSGVRVHADTNAQEMNETLGAKAFTKGKDIYFGAGQYNPTSSDGKRLLAHELTHVVQQKATQDTPNIQRYAIRSKDTGGEPPHKGWAHVPKKEVKRLEATKKIVEKAITKKGCSEYVKKHAKSGDIKAAFDKAQLWKIPKAEKGLYGKGDSPGDNIAYTNKSYKIGRWTLAATIIHELMHNCGVTDEKIAEKANQHCGKLPQVPVGERDKGGIVPTPKSNKNKRPKDGYRYFYKAVKKEIKKNNKKIDISKAFMDFPTLKEDELPVECLSGRIGVKKDHSFWDEATMGDLDEIAEAAVEACF